MLVERQERDGWAVLRLRVDRFDFAVAAEVKEAILDRLAAGDRHLLIDLSQVLFVDSSGLGALIGVLKRLGPGDRLELTGLSRGVRKVFELTRLDTVFAIRADESAR